MLKHTDGLGTYMARIGPYVKAREVHDLMQPDTSKMISK